MLFELTKTGQETILHCFGANPDGQEPYAGPIRDSLGNLYGVTHDGGEYGQGSIYEVTAAGVETVLYSFTMEDAGDGHDYPLIRDSKGNLYGTTDFGGANGDGTAFELTPAGAYKVLHTFSGTADGIWPQSSLLRDAKGNLYGEATESGPNGYGTVYEITKKGAFKVLYGFTGGADGAWPMGGLIEDKAGNLYGTTMGSGASGHGTVFELTPTGVESVLYSFAGGTDAASPQGALVQDKEGNLYGTTTGGGAYGYGTVFEVTLTGTEKVLYSFTDGTDGGMPYSPLILDAKGNLYGTTYYGGEYGTGTVFEVKP
jgi:uncharacterized repeat protein (TIGR03803 family)